MRNQTSQITLNLNFAEMFKISSNNSQLLLKRFPPKSLMIDKRPSLITGCLIASDGLHYSSAKFNVEFKMKLDSNSKSLCDYFEDETISIPANLEKGHIIYKFKTQFIHNYLSFMNKSIKGLNFYLMNVGGAFEIYNNSEIVIALNEFYQKPNVCLFINIFFVYLCL